MSEYTSISIPDLIDGIEKNRYVLPAMQRNFVWSANKICDLFESIMQGYPIGTFLFWKLSNVEFHSSVFNGFVKDYDDEKKSQRGEKLNDVPNDFNAVLDGQQRITSLYLGLKGKRRERKSGTKIGQKDSYQDTFLCINALFKGEEQKKYQFAFKAVDEIEKLNEGMDELWIKVADLQNMGQLQIMHYVLKLFDGISDGQLLMQLQQKTMEPLTQFYTKFALGGIKQISFYTCQNMGHSEVVDIFQRVNSGGEKLSASDLLLSIASAEDTGLDIHRRVQDSLADIYIDIKNRDAAFNVTKDLLLKSGLMFCTENKISLTAKENRTSGVMSKVFGPWEQIIKAWQITVCYVEDLGFSGKHLSESLLMPIAYYFFKNNTDEKHYKNTDSAAICDRIFISQWILRAMLKEIFMDGTGQTLKTIRDIFNSANCKCFPLEDLMTASLSKKDLTIGDEEIEAILNINYEDGKEKPILCELYNDRSKVTDEVDHIWPKTKLLHKREFKKMHPTGTEDELKEFKKNCHALPNLELLPKPLNQQKAAWLFDQWLYSDNFNEAQRKAFITQHFIPHDGTYSYREFLEFFEERKKLLRAQLKKAFPSSFEKLLERNNLKNHYMKCRKYKLS